MDAKNDLLIYVVEDNKIYNHFVCEYLRKLKYSNVKSFLSGKNCIETVLKGESPDIVIQDYFLDDCTGIEVMKGVKKHSKNSEFIFLTVNGSLEEAVNTVKMGAYDYILKDNDTTLEKVAKNIEDLIILIHRRKKNKTIRLAMVVSAFILILIVLFALLHFLYDAFGIK